MGLKLYLNKFLKVDNIESYTYSELVTLKKEYEKVLENSEGVDPDFPMYVFGGGGKKIGSGGVNAHTLTKQINEEDESVYSSSIDTSKNTTVEERALDFLRSIGMRN